MLQEEEVEAGPSLEAEKPEDIFKICQNRLADQAQAKKQVPGHDLQMNEEDRPSLRQIEQSERFVNKLTADSMEQVTNVLVAASARELKRREEATEANILRLEKLENEAKSNTELFDKIMNKWTKAKTKVIHQELRDDMSKEQELCSQYIEDKNKLIGELQQELKAKEYRFVKDRKVEAEEVDLLIKRMQEQISSLKKDYRKELSVIDSLLSDEWKSLLTANKSKLEQQSKEQRSKELEYLLQRIKMFEEHEVLLNRLRVERAEEYNKIRIKLDTYVKHLEQNLQESKATNQFNQGKLEYNVQMLNKFEEEYAISKAQQLRNITKQHARLINLKKKRAVEEKKSQVEIQALTNKFKLLTQHHKDIQKRIRVFAVADANRYEEIWLMNEDKAKALVGKVLDLDNIIHEKLLGLTWSPPSLPVMDDSGSKQAQCTEQQDAAWVLREEDETEQERGTLNDADSPESSTPWVDSKTVNRVLELLCDEMDFLTDSKADKLLSSMEKNEQTILKMDSIFTALGIKNEVDLHKMTKFFQKYKQPHTGTNQAENLIHPNDLLRGLRAFTAQHCKKKTRKTARHKSRALMLGTMNESEVEAYWENIVNVIPESKLKVWEALEAGLKKYNAELTKRAKLLSETQRLKQQNAEFCMLLRKQSSRQDDAVMTYM